MRNTLLILGIAALSACSTPSSTEQQALHSGAFEALSLYGNARNYPLGKIPDGAYYAAWEAAKDLPQHHYTRSTSWSSIGPHNRAGRTLCLAFNPLNANTLYAGSASGGLWRSYTGGIGTEAWERIPTGFPVLAVSCIALPADDSLTIFIGTGEVYNHQAAGTGAAYRNTRGSYGIGILRSLDGGSSWEKSLDFSMSEEQGVWDVAIAQSNPEIIYAATTAGIYKSTNGGDSWSLSLEIDQVTDLVVHPENPDIAVAGCGNFGSPGHGIYNTSNGGSTWVKATTGVPDEFFGKVQLSNEPQFPNLVYASIGNGFGFDDGASWLCKSTDFGQNWTFVNTTDYSLWQGWFAHDVAINPTDSNRLAVIGIDVWTSSNGGASLSKKSEGGIGFVNPPIEGPDGYENFVHSDCHDVIWHPEESNTFYVASDGGIHRTDDGGNNYYSCNSRYQTTQFYNGFSVSAQDSLFVLGGMQDNGTSRLNAEVDPLTGEYLTWSLQFGGDGGWTAINQQADFISYVSYQFLNVQTWDGIEYSSLFIPVIQPVAFIAPYLLSPSQGNVMYAGSAGIAKSVDEGASWTMTNGGDALDGNPVLSMAISAYDNNVVYAATAPYGGNPSGVFVTQDGGTTWSDVTGILPDRFPMDICTDPTNDAVAYITYSGFGSGHVFRTGNYGATWEDISGSLPDIQTNAVTVDPSYPSHIYVGNDIGIFLSEDSGSTWVSYMDGLPEAVMVFDLQIQQQSRKLYAATHGNGAYWSDLEDVPVSAAVSAIDNSWSIYPTLTTTGFFLETSGHMKGAQQLTVLDWNGNAVYQTALLEQGGERQWINLPGISTGVYFVVLSDGMQRQTKKITVL